MSGKLVYVWPEVVEGNTRWTWECTQLDQAGPYFSQREGATLHAAKVLKDEPLSFQWTKPGINLSQDALTASDALTDQCERLCAVAPAQSANESTPEVYQNIKVTPEEVDLIREALQAHRSRLLDNPRHLKVKGDGQLYPFQLEALETITAERITAITKIDSQLDDYRNPGQAVRMAA